MIIYKSYSSLFKDNKADVILKYNADEARSLKAYGELPEHGNVWVINLSYGVITWWYLDEGIWVEFCGFYILLCLMGFTLSVPACTW